MTRTRSRNARPKNAEANARERMARHGLSLPRAMLRALEEHGIYCFPGISVEHQHLAKRFVLKGTESGGAVESMGRYCGYLDSDGQPISWLQPLDSFGGNGRHAIVIAKELVRIEMLRFERTYELLISRHVLREKDGGARPELQSGVLFRGRGGTLPTELQPGDARKSGRGVPPIFHTGSGEIHRSPPKFDEAIQTISQAVACIRCKHTHIAVRPRIIGDAGLDDLP